VAAVAAAVELFSKLLICSATSACCLAAAAAAVELFSKLLKCLVSRCASSRH